MKNYNIKIGAAIFAIIVLHFVSQSVLFQNENSYSKVEVAPVAEINRESEPRKIEVVNDSATAVPIVRTEIIQPETRTLTPQSASKKKNEMRETKEARQTRAERLRYAEKLLTGI